MKKLNFKGFSHVELFVVLVVIVAVGALGFFGYQRFQNSNSNKAEAGSLLRLSSFNSEGRTKSYSACKTNRRSTPLNTSYTVRLIVSASRKFSNNTSQYYTGGKITQKDGRQLSQKWSNKWWNGNLQSQEFPNTRDTRILKVGTARSNGYREIRVSQLPNC